MKVKYKAKDSRLLTPCPYTSHRLVSGSIPVVSGLYCRTQCKHFIMEYSFNRIVECSYINYLLEDDLFKI